MVKEIVVIVGAGQSGLATAACLNKLGVPNVVLERDDCIGSLWRKRSYDRVSLHLAKQFCQLPHLPHPPTAPTFITKSQFVQYLDDYASRFEIKILFRREVKSATFDDEEDEWHLAARNLATGESEDYSTRFLVVASGENDGIVEPEIAGIKGFEGEVVHSSRYRSGEKYGGKAVLVVGSGNSGMEIAYDLASFGTRSSVVVRSPIHVVTREIWLLGMHLTKFLPCWLVDATVLSLCYLVFGDTSKHGIDRPTKGPFYLKANSTTYPVLDIGTFKKIKSGEIQVLPSLKCINGNALTFRDGRVQHFDAIVLATGYRSMIKKWLKTDDYLIGDDGMAKQKYPNHYKGKNGLYCAGLIMKGIYGSAEDAIKIANDISDTLKHE